MFRLALSSMRVQDATSSDNDEVASPRPAKRKAGQQVFVDDESAESEGEVDPQARAAVGAVTGATAEPAAKKPRATAEAAGKKPRATVVIDSDSDDAVEAVDEGTSLVLVGRGLQGLHLNHRMLATPRIRHRSFQEAGVLLLQATRQQCCPFAHICVSNQALAPIPHNNLTFNSWMTCFFTPTGAVPCADAQWFQALSQGKVLLFLGAMQTTQHL